MTRLAARRRGMATVLGAAVLSFAGGAAAQEIWKPERPVEIVVTCQPGCGPDIAARTIQKIWQESRIVAVLSVVVNKPGGVAVWNHTWRLSGQRQSMSSGKRK